MANNAKNPSTMSKKNSMKHWSTRQMVTIAVFIAIGSAISFVEIPLLPAVPYIKYDPSGIVSLVAALVFGPLSGAVVAVLSWVPRLVTNPYGAVISIVCNLAMVIPVGLIYKHFHTRMGSIAGMFVGSILATAVAVVLNLLITPLYTDVPLSVVAAMIVPILIPFNLIKVGLNSVFTQLIYKPISHMVQDDSKTKAANMAARSRTQSDDE